MKMKIAPILSTAFLLAACSGLIRQSPIATPTTPITMEQAQKLAMHYGVSGGFNFRSESSNPQIIATELISLKDAYTRSNLSIPAGEDPDALVWFIRLKGSWRDAFPVPTGAPTPEAQPFLEVIIDSQSGMVLDVGTSNS